MMLLKRIFSISFKIISLSFFFPMTVFAHLISISATSPFPASVPVSTTVTAAFTVTNITSNVPLTVIDQSQFPKGSGLSIIANTCGSLMAAGQSCVITLGLNAPATPQTIFTKLKEWAKPSADGVTFPFSVQIVNTPPPPAASTPWVAVGDDFDDSSPLLAVSTDGANTWETKSITGFPSPTGSLDLATCVGSGANAICTTVGKSGSIPALAVSSDGGSTWAGKSIIGLPASGEFFGVGCTGSGVTAVCTAAGKNFSADLGLLVASVDGANTWAIRSVPGIPAGSFFTSADCTGNTICTAAGYYISGGQRGLLAVSTDSTLSWVLPSISGLPTFATFNGVSCVGSGSSAICTAAGYAGIPPANSPLIVASFDGGNTWAVQSITGVPANGAFDQISCTGIGANAVCVAVGAEEPSFTPLVVTSTNGGSTWIRQPISDPTLGEFFGVSCTGSGSSAICAAVGEDFTGSFPPVVVVSIDGGVTWTRKSITGLPAEGFFLGAKCTGTGANAVCITGGSDFTGAGSALLAVSTDGANTWEVKAVTGLSPSGSYNGVGSSNSS